MSQRAHTPDILTRTESLNALARQAPLNITGLTGGGTTNLDGMDASDTPIGTRMSLVVGSYRYDYTMKASVAAEDAPTIIVPDTGGEGKRWILDQIPAEAGGGGGGGSGATGNSVRETFTQASHGFVAEDSVYHNGTEWVKGKADAVSTARVVGVIESVTTNQFVLVFGGDITLTGKTPGATYYLSPSTAGLLTATEPTSESHFIVSVLEAITATSGVVRISDTVSLAKLSLTTDVSGILPALNGGAGAVNGIMQANGSGLVTAVTIGSGLSYVGGSLTATGGGGASVSDSLFSAGWDGVTTVAPSKNAVYDLFGDYVNRMWVSHSAGTAAVLAASGMTTLAFGTANAVAALARAGTWLILAKAVIHQNNVTYAAEQTVTIGLRRTNNTPADLSDGSTQIVHIPIQTNGFGTLATAVVFLAYDTLNGDDTIDIQGNLSALPSSGTMEVSATSIFALLLKGTGDSTPPTIVTPDTAINTLGTTLTVKTSETVVVGSGGSAGFALTASGGAATLTFSSQPTSTTLAYTISRAIESGETVTLAYTQPGNGIEDSSGNDLATVSGVAVANNSTAGGGGEPTYIVDENFEGSGTPASWFLATANPDASTTGLSLGGAECLSLTGIGAAYANTPTFDLGEVWVQFRVRFTSTPAGGSNFVNFVDSGFNNIAVVGRTSGTALQCGAAGSGATMVDLAANNTSFYVWAHYSKGTGTNAVTEVYVSTTTTRPAAASNSHAKEINGTATANVAFIQFNNASAAHEFYIDDVKVAASEIP